MLFIMGCASSSSTGVVPMGPDTWTVTGQSASGPGYAQKQALEDANAFAATKGKYMIPVRSEAGWHTDPFWGPEVLQHTYELRFRLVDSDDPEYQRTNLETKPETLIIKHEND